MISILHLFLFVKLVMWTHIFISSFSFFLLVLVNSQLSRPSQSPLLTILLRVLHPTMASSSTVLDLVDKVELRAHGLGILFLLSVDDLGFAAVSFVHLSIRFVLHALSIWVKREFPDPISHKVSHFFTEASTQLEDRSTLWSLHPNKYWVYDITNLQMVASTEIL